VISARKLQDISVFNRLERKFGQFAIPNLTLVLIIGQVFVYFAGMRDPEILERFVLDSARLREGEWSRLVTFLLMPPGTALIWAFFFWYMLYLMGTALETYWGAFRYNVFLLIGYLATVGAALLLPTGSMGNWFLQGTVFLAFAWLNPDFIIQIFFVLPVKIKWLALLTWIGFGYSFIFGDWNTRLSVGASVANFFVFFGRDVYSKARYGRRQMVREVRKFTEKPAEYFHRCTVCGITDKTHPQMDFRYCSRCAGNECYCSDHLRSHEHVVVNPSADSTR
jgi:hypothetical protein